MTITYGSICSGIEAASLAWDSIGYQPLWFSEIEAFPKAVLKQRWPDVGDLHDMCLLPNFIKTDLIPSPDVLVGGTPCQSYSIAGSRDGLDDERGKLTLKFVETANEIDAKRRGRESVIIWENVTGVLSDRGNAFGHFLGLLAGESVALKPSGGRWTDAGCVHGPKRAIAWRVLDAQHFGLAQRRRRVFVVASGRDGFDPRKVLFESSQVHRDSKASRASKQGLTPCVAGSATKRGPAVRTFRMVSFGEYVEDTCASTLKARDYKDATDLILDDRARRLMPVESERLQGMPDNHTRIEWRGKPAELCPDGPRYKAIGNSKAVTVIRWIGKRIKKELEQCL